MLKALLSISGQSSYKHDIEVVVVSLIGRYWDKGTFQV